MREPYLYVWRNNPRRVELYGRICFVLARGTLNSCLLEFEDGDRVVGSRFAIRRAAPLSKHPTRATAKALRHRDILSEKANLTALDRAYTGLEKS